MRYSRYLQSARAARYLSLGSLASSLTVAAAAVPLAGCATEQLTAEQDAASALPLGATSVPARTARRSDIARVGREPEPDIDGDVEALRTRLALASSDLLYRSETDAPFVVIRSDLAVPLPVDQDVVLAAFALDASRPVERISLDDFFARHIERADLSDRSAAREVAAFRRLRELLRHSLDDVQVYRVGTIAIDCLVVGTDRHGHLVGVRTLSVET